MIQADVHKENNSDFQPFIFPYHLQSIQEEDIRWLSRGIFNIENTSEDNVRKKGKQNLFQLKHLFEKYLMG